MQDAGKNLDDSGKKGKDILDDFGKALLSNFQTDAISKVVLELDNGASLLLKQFGVGQEMAQTLRATMADAAMGVKSLGGNIGDVIKVQEEASKALQRNVILSADVNKDLYATAQVTGKEVSELVKTFKDTGFGAAQVAKEMKNVVDIAAQSGVNAKDVSDKVLSNMDALNKYNFEGGVSGLAKMAAQASMLRIDMKTTLGFAEKVFDPEGAIEMAAAMQRLGVTQSSLLDPLKLMDLAQNDPAELQNQLAEMSKKFVQLGKDGNFEIAPGAKREMRELEQQLKLPAGELAKMALASSELERKMSQIRFSDALEIDEDKQKMIANMAEMGTGGKYEVQIENDKGEVITKAIEDLSKEDVKALEKMANTAPKTMEDMAKEQLSFTKTIDANISKIANQTGLGVARTKTAGNLLTAGRDISTSAGNILTPKQMSSKNLGKSIDNTVNENLNILKKISEGEITKTEGLKEVTSNLLKLSSSIDSTFKSVYEVAKLEHDKLSKKNPVIGQLTTLFSGKIPEASSRATSNTNNIETVRNTSSAPANNTQTQPTNASTDRPIEITLNHNIDLKTSGNIDTNQVVMALKNTDVQQGMVSALKEAMYNNGLLAPTSNKTQLMNPSLSKNLVG